MKRGLRPPGIHAGALVRGLFGIAVSFWAPEVRASSQTLPAYAHNDYRNPKPLSGALEAGFRGVEVDYFVVDGQLRVGHSRSEAQEGPTLEEAYLEPLRARIEAHGSVHADGNVFTLNLESKEAGQETYDSLHSVLERYAHMLTVVRNGVEHPGPVQVILVGWHPELEALARQPVRYVSVHRHFDSMPDTMEQYPAHLLRMISVHYRRTFRWRGRRPRSGIFSRGMARVIDTKTVVPGRVVRVFEVPRVRSVYVALLDAGVDLIGTKTVHESARLLRSIDPAGTQ